MSKATLLFHYPTPTLRHKVGGKAVQGSMIGREAEGVPSGGQEALRAGPCPPKCVFPLAGLAADAQLLRLMTLRYGDGAGRMGCSDFVCCMLRLETMSCE